jgi:pimeloyl-ACP methyl ester carboxylesterase
VGRRLQCATLDVPLDWDAPDATITLALAKSPATGDRIGSLVTNPGGPGASGLRFLATRPFSETVHDRFDVVSWDPRGVGRSTALQCGSGVPELLSLDPDPDDASEQLTL